jgi:hypothetical protein
LAIARFDPDKDRQRKPDPARFRQGDTPGQNAARLQIEQVGRLQDIRARLRAMPVRGSRSEPAVTFQGLR